MATKTFHIRVRGDYVNHYSIKAESLTEAEDIAKEKSLDEMQDFSLDVEEYNPREFE